MSSSYVDCQICGVGFDAQNVLSLFCNMCACEIGSCCKDDYLHCLEEPGDSGEMSKDKCPFCNKQEPVDYFLLRFALKKLGLTHAELFAEYQKTS